MQAGGKTKTILLAAASVAYVITSVASYIMIQRPKQRKIQPKYYRTALMRPMLGKEATPWEWILTYGGDSDFPVSINIKKSVLLDVILPKFLEKRKLVNEGSPFLDVPKNRKTGKKLQSSFVDILGLSLWFLKGKNPAHRLFTVFGLVHSSIYIWLDFGLDVLYKTVICPYNTEFEIR